MSIEIARKLYKSGEGHALSAAMLYRAAVDHAIDMDMPEPEEFAFNGICSLSIFFLIGLGLELYLKSAYVYHGGTATDEYLRDEIGHKLVRALNKAELQGFVSEAPNLRAIVDRLNKPYFANYFRYVRPDQFKLPEAPQIFEALKILDGELKALPWPE